MRLTAVFATVLTLAAVPVLAQPKAPSAAQQAQQDRMRSCNADAGDRHLAGNARKDFMSACLADKRTPQAMMKICNAEATQEKMASDARKTYLGSCLKS